MNKSMLRGLGLRGFRICILHGNLLLKSKGDENSFDFKFLTLQKIHMMSISMRAMCYS